MKRAKMAVGLRKPRFLWQGMLIVLPAIFLAVMGIWSLKQDRILALHEATETAKKITTDLARFQLPLAFKTELPASAEMLRPPARSSEPREDPAYEWANGPEPRVVCLVNAQAELIYPPPTQPLPVPQSLPYEELTQEQANEWEAAQTQIYQEGNWKQAGEVLAHFLGRQPPKAFAALARFQQGMLYHKQNEHRAAQQALELVVSQFADMVNESGVPLGIYARLQLLQFSSDPGLDELKKQSLMDAIGQYALANPSAASPFWLAKAAEIAGDSAASTRRWLKVWQAHEQARALQTFYRESMESPLRLRATETLRAAPRAGANAAVSAGSSVPRFDPTWLSSDPEQSWLVLPQAETTNYWLVGWPEAVVQQLVHEVLAFQSLPTYLGLAVDVAGKRLWETSPGTELLTVSGNSPGGADDIGWIRVIARLANPGQLYMRQRIRTIWFGALIALSAGSVLAGFMTAWRAFNRQQHLNEMKTNFVSSVSHELRAPIASVRLIAEELEEAGVADAGKVRQYHHFIGQECRRLSALIENVLDFARHEQGRKQYEFEPTDMTALVETTAQLMRAYSQEKRIAIDVSIHGAPCEPEADGRALQQVLVNLIDNAIKHSPADSIVTVGLDYAPVIREPSAGDHDGQASWVQLWVEDRGEGIPAEDHARIFERFYRRGSELRRETQGVGLGLAIVKYVTEAHQGRVWVRSAPGQGSRFTVELPVKARPQLNL